MWHRKLVLHVLFMLVALGITCQARSAEKRERHGEFHGTVSRLEFNNDVAIYIYGDNADAAIEGGSAEVHCDVNAADLRYVTWTFGYVVLTNETEVFAEDSRIIPTRFSAPSSTFRSYTLTINRLRQSDAGRYWCSVYYGDSMSEAHVGFILQITPEVIGSSVTPSMALNKEVSESSPLQPNRGIKVPLFIIILVIFTVIIWRQVQVLGIVVLGLCYFGVFRQRNGTILMGLY